MTKRNNKEIGRVSIAVESEVRPNVGEAAVYLNCYGTVKTIQISYDGPVGLTVEMERIIKEKDLGWMMASAIEKGWIHEFGPRNEEDET